MTNGDHIQVTLTYKPYPDSPELLTEEVAATKVDDYYQLTGAPVFAPGVAFGDIVRVEHQQDKFHLVELIRESGHSTVHIVILKAGCKDSLLSVLYEFNCILNPDVGDNYLVVTITKETSYEPIRLYLQAEEDKENLTFRESSLSKVHRQFANEKDH